MNAQIASDRELLNQYLQGDKGAISTLIEKHNRRVRDYIRMMVGDSDLAADIAQETFIKAVSVIDAGRYVGSGNFYHGCSALPTIKLWITSVRRRATALLASRAQGTMSWVQ